MIGDSPSVRIHPHMHPENAPELSTKSRAVIVVLVS